MARWAWGLEGGVEPKQRPSTSSNTVSIGNNDSILLCPEKRFMQTRVTTH